MSLIMTILILELWNRTANRLWEKSRKPTMSGSTNQHTISITGQIQIPEIFNILRPKKSSRISSQITDWDQSQGHMHQTIPSNSFPWVVCLANKVTRVLLLKNQSTESLLVTKWQVPGAKEMLYTSTICLYRSIDTCLRGINLVSS